MNHYQERDWNVRKIIARARKNGWDMQYYVCPDHGAYRMTTGRAYCCENWFRNIVLRKDFAKAFFGEQEKPRYKMVDEVSYRNIPEYLYQLQVMAIENDLESYLVSFL